MEAKTEQDIRGRRKNKFGDEFIVENPDREMREFDTDTPDVMAMFMAHIDWLAEQGCHEEAELMMYDWGIRIGNVARTENTTKRIAELRKKFQVKDTKLVHQQVDGPRGRKQTITLFLEEPIGCYYSKATVNLLHMENAAFQDRLHHEPILSLLLACNGTSASGLVAKYMDYKWLKKCMKLELNNLEIGFTQFRELFKNTEVAPYEVVITGRNKNPVTTDQLKLLPVLCPNLKHLWSIDYHGVKWDYRTASQVAFVTEHK